MDLAEKAYRTKETEYPVLVAVTRFGRMVNENQIQLDEQALASWASERFEKTITADDLRGETLNDVRRALLTYSEANYEIGRQQNKVASTKVAEVFGASSKNKLREIAGSNGALDSLSSWLDQNLSVKLPPEELGNSIAMVCNARSRKLSMIVTSQRCVAWSDKCC